MVTENNNYPPPLNGYHQDEHGRWVPDTTNDTSHSTPVNDSTTVTSTVNTPQADPIADFSYVRYGSVFEFTDASLGQIKSREWVFSGPQMAKVSLVPSIAGAAGNEFYIADQNNDRIRKVSGSGTISTVIGTGERGSSAITEALNATMNSPSCVTFRKDGGAYDMAYAYFTDSGNHRVRVSIGYGVSVVTIAGNGTPGFSGDGGLASSAQLNSPAGIVVDTAGNVYIADYGNNRVRKVDVITGFISTIAGTGEAGYSGDSGSATDAKLYHPIGLALDSSENIYIADSGNNRIRKITAGTITTVAGSGEPSFGGDSGAATSAHLYNPRGICFDASDNLFIADAYNNRVRVVSGGIITTIAGNGLTDYTGDNIAATSSSLSSPLSVFISTMGDLFIADSYHYRVRKVVLGTGIITTAAGSGVAGFGGDDRRAMATTEKDPTIDFTDMTGTISATLTVYGSKSSSKTVTLTLTGPEPLAPDFSYNAGGLGVLFTDMSNIPGERTWYFGDGAASTLTNPYHMYSSLGTYLVTLRIQSGASSYSKAKSVLVNEPSEGGIEAVATLGAYGSGDGQFEDASALAVDDDFIYVLDGRTSYSDTARVTIFNRSTHAFVAKFGAWGTGDGQWRGGKGLAVDDDYIYLAGDGRIQKFNKTSPYAFVSKITDSGLNYRIAVDDTQLYASHQGSGAYGVKVYNKATFEYIGICGSDTFGVGNGQMRNPMSIALDDDNIYVVDSLAGILQSGVPGDLQIQIYNKTTLAFVGELGAYGEGDGQLQCDVYTYDWSGIAVDNNYIYVLDYTKKIQWFDKTTYAYVGKYSEFISGYSARDLCLDGTDIYALTDAPNNQIRVYSNEPPNATLSDRPRASFTASRGEDGLTYTFTDTSTNTPTSWLWKFGDGTTSTEQNPTHTFTPGNYTVKLTATNSTGSSSYLMGLPVSLELASGGGSSGGWRAYYPYLFYPTTPISGGNVVGVGGSGYVYGETFNSILGKIGAYAVDTEHDRVLILGEDSTILKTFGSKGSTHGKFNNPTTCSLINGKQGFDRATVE